MDRRTFITLSTASVIGLAMPAIASTPNPMVPVVDWFATKSTEDLILSYGRSEEFTGSISLVGQNPHDLQIVSGATLAEIMNDHMPTRDPSQFDLTTDNRLNYIQSTGNLCAHKNRRSSPNMATYTDRGIVLFYHGRMATDVAVMSVGKDRYALNTNEVAKDMEYPFLSYFNMAIGGIERDKHVITDYNERVVGRNLVITNT